MDNLGHTSPSGREMPDFATPTSEKPNFNAPTAETPDFAPSAPEAPNFVTQNPPENPPADASAARNRGINIIDSAMPPEAISNPVVGADAMDEALAATPSEAPASEQIPNPEQPPAPEQPPTPEQSQPHPNQPNQPNQPYIINVNSTPAQPTINPTTPTTPGADNPEITNTANYLGHEAKNKANFGETAKATLLEGIDKDPLTFYSNFQKLRNNVPLGNKNVQNPTLYGGNS